MPAKKSPVRTTSPLRTSDLLYQWSDIRDEVAPWWWGENGSSAYKDDAQRLSASFTNFHAKRSEFPHFKK